VAAPATGDPRVHLRPHRHDSGGVVVPLTRYPGRVQVFKHLLGPGEVAEFDPTEPHWFGPADGTAVEILHLFGPRGDRAVVRVGGPDTTETTRTETTGTA
jgi:hypothetical protein